MKRKREREKRERERERERERDRQTERDTEKAISEERNGERKSIIRRHEIQKQQQIRRRLLQTKKVDETQKRNPLNCKEQVPRRIEVK